MDFMTAVPYWGIFFLIIINAVIVARMKIEIEEEGDESELV